MPVALVEIGLVTAVAVDGCAAVGRLGVDDAVDRGDRVAGEVGVLSARGDAGPAGEVWTVRASQKLGGPGVDLLGDTAHALVVRGGRGARRRCSWVVDRSLEPVEVVGESWLTLAGRLVAPLLRVDLDAIVVDGLADCLPRGRAVALEQRAGEQAAWITAGGPCIPGNETVVSLGMSTPVCAPTCASTRSGMIVGSASTLT